LVVILVFAIPLYEPANLMPVLGHGPVNTLLIGMSRSSGYAEVVALAVFLGALQGMGHFKKAGIISLIISGLIVGSSMFFYIMAFPVNVAVENTNPLLNMTRVIEYGRFFQRFESIFLFAWSISAILAVGISLYITLSIYAKVFRIDDHRVLVLPLAVVLFNIAILPRDLSSLVYIYVAAIREFGWAVAFGLPVLTLLVAVVRGKKGGPAGA